MSDSSASEDDRARFSTVTVLSFESKVHFVVSSYQMTTSFSSLDMDVFIFLPRICSCVRIVPTMGIFMTKSMEKPSALQRSSWALIFWTISSGVWAETTAPDRSKAAIAARKNLIFIY